MFWKRFFSNWKKQSYFCWNNIAIPPSSLIMWNFSLEIKNELHKLHSHEPPWSHSASQRCIDGCQIAPQVPAYLVVGMVCLLFFIFTVKATMCCSSFVLVVNREKEEKKGGAVSSIILPLSPKTVQFYFLLYTCASFI